MSAPTSIRVLILEDNPSDADLMVDALRLAGLDPRWERVDLKADFEARLTPELDLILSDYALPQFNGVQALRLVRSRGLDVPFILVSGSIGEDIAVEAMRNGADDYLLKDRMARLGPAVLQALEKRHLRKETELAEAARRESDERFRQIAENIHEVFYLTNSTSTEMLYISPAYERVWGRKRESLYAKPDSWTDAIHPDDRPRVLEEFEKGLTAGQFDFEYRIVQPDGSIRWIRDRGFPIREEQGNLRRIAGIAEDITEQKQAEIKIKGLNRVYAMLSGINTLIVRVKSRQELFEEACRIAVEHGGFSLAWIGTLDAQTLDITPLAWAGAGAGEYLSNTSITARPDVREGQGMVGTAIRERRPVFTNDIAVETFTAGSERRKEAIRRGYRSVVILPLIMEKAVAGCFALFSKETGFFNDEELKLLTELAANISFALEHMARQEKIDKLSRIRAVLGEINAAIVRIRSKQELFDEACRIAVEAGKFAFAWLGLVDREANEVRPAAWAGAEAGFLGKIQAARKLAGRTDQGQTASAQAVLEKKAVVANDVQNDPRILRKQEHLERKINAVAMLPLLIADEAVGVLALHAREIGFFDEEEMKLLNELAGDIAFALQTIEKQEKLDYLSYYDPLTGLPNRRLFMDRAGQQMRLRGGEPLMVAMIVMNLERFRNINETFGRGGGDALLKLVADRLEAAFHGKDYIARIGADNFGVVVRGMRDAAAVVHAFESQILDCFREPFKLDDTEVRVAARAGVAMFPADGMDVDTLFANADAALKRARVSGERFLFYAADMNARAAQIVSLETRLRRAVEAREFVLHYQPKIDLSTAAICGLEALIRWQEPGAELVAPGTFIPLLEETGLILPVGKWALERALRDHGEWTARGCRVPRIAVNVSAIQLQQHEFVDMVSGIVQEHGDNPDALELEITESMLMRDTEGSIRKLTLLRGLGIHVAMDDFGTGYSSLSSIGRLPINSIKIDRSFINGVAGNPQDTSIVTTIIALAHSLNLRVVAEGVETEEQSRLLRLLKCDEAQGYLFSRPLPGGEIEALLRAPAPPARQPARR